ncbi:MAG: hypothetical protein MJB14_23450, partial [Spirochaetes bacterium]|nr:hypothetical protein [Spirochaetota bacterium]
MKSEQAYYLWEYFDKMGKGIDSMQDDEEKFLSFPLLNHDLAKNFANGAYTLQQVSRLLEMHFLDLDKDNDKLWTPTILLVPVAEFHKGTLQIINKVIFSRTQEKNGFSLIQKYLEMAAEITAEALLQWIVTEGTQSPLELHYPLEEKLGPLDENGLLFHESDFFEYELRQKLFLDPLLDDEINFTRDHALKYYVPQYIDMIISFLKDIDFTEPRIENEGIAHMYTEPIFLLKITDRAHIIKPLVYRSDDKSCDLVYHYLKQAYCIINNFAAMVGDLVTDSMKGYLAEFEDYREIVSNPLSEIFVLFRPLLDQCNRFREMPVAEDHKFYAVYRELVFQIDLFLLLHKQVISFHEHRLSTLTQLRLAEL